jgi:hypothetical protein
MASGRLVSSAISPPILGVPSAMSNLIEGRSQSGVF